MTSTTIQDTGWTRLDGATMQYVEPPEEHGFRNAPGVRLQWFAN